MGQRIFADPSIPAFFRASQKPFKVIPQKNPHTRQIEFLVEGENIDEALNELFSNPLIGVLDFLKELKSLRSSIFALKGNEGKQR